MPVLTETFRYTQGFGAPTHLAQALDSPYQAPADSLEPHTSEDFLGSLSRDNRHSVWW